MKSKQPSIWARLSGLAILLVLGIVACGGGNSPGVFSAANSSSDPTTIGEPDAGQPVPANPSDVSSVPSAGTPTGPSEVRLEISEGTEAAYLVNEQLANINLPGDAIATTTSVSGVILLGASDLIPAEGSELRVDLRTLASDKFRRDRYVRRETLSTFNHPFAVFVPRKLPGIPSPLPAQGDATFQMIGDMTIHGVTSELVWNVTATFTEDEVTGRATTEFPFDKFGMTRPRVRLVLSVEDLIRLRINFRMVKVIS